MNAHARLTLVARDGLEPYAWIEAADAPHRLAFVDSEHAVLAALAAIVEPTLDVERAILHRSVSAEEFLDLLAALPREFSGDVLRVDDLERGFLSAAGRGGGRELYALGADDVRFYLEAHGLVESYEYLEKTA